ILDSPLSSRQILIIGSKSLKGALFVGGANIRLLVFRQDCRVSIQSTPQNNGSSGDRISNNHPVSVRIRMYCQSHSQDIPYRPDALAALLNRYDFLFYPVAAGDRFCPRNGRFAGDHRSRASAAHIRNLDGTAATLGPRELYDWGRRASRPPDRTGKSSHGHCRSTANRLRLEASSKFLASQNTPGIGGCQIPVSLVGPVQRTSD